jgi:hypothetical protein
MEHKLVKREIKIGNLTKEIMFTQLEQLPSGNRCYPDIGKIYIRGLFYGEILELSKLNDNSLETSLKVYRDAIQFENDTYSLEDLELIDYIFVTSISNILTSEDYKWYPDFKCFNIIKNPKLTELELDLKHYKNILNELNKKLPSIKSDEEKENIQKDIEIAKKQISELEEKIENFDEDLEVECGVKVSTPITIDDISFEIKDSNIIFPLYYNFNNTELVLMPLNVKDEIDLEKKIEEGYTFDIAFLAKHIKNIPFEDAYNLIRSSMPYEVNQLIEYVDRFKIKINPIKTQCPRCGKQYDLSIELKDIKVLPIL